MFTHLMFVKGLAGEQKLGPIPEVAQVLGEGHMANPQAWWVPPLRACRGEFMRSSISQSPATQLWGAREAKAGLNK